MNEHTDPTRRFSNRVEDYVRYRPGYPAEILGHLENVCGLTASWVIADVGAGTGLLAELFLKNGNQVFGVQPNDQMRAAGAGYLADFPNFISIAGSAEHMKLTDSSVDLITAGQAFHWFEPEQARDEFRRVLKPRGWAALIWNVRRKDGSPLMTEYEELIRRYAQDDGVLRPRGNEGGADLDRFFGHGGVHLETFDNGQTFDFEALTGRLRSSSYAPLPDHADYAEMIDRLREIFDRYEESGVVRFAYQTQIYVGQMK